MQTKFGASKDIVEYLRKCHEQTFKKGVPLYGWYDAIAEFEVSSRQELGNIIDDLKCNFPNVNHIATAVEKNSASHPLMKIKRAK